MSCTDYLILEGDNLSTIFSGVSLNIFGFKIDTMHLFATVAVLIVFPTRLLKDLQFLSYLSGIAKYLHTMFFVWIHNLNDVLWFLQPVESLQR